jgi:hypothetical protein
MEHLETKVDMKSADCGGGNVERILLLIRIALPGNKSKCIKVRSYRQKQITGKICGER